MSNRILYHYTSISGLENILKTQSLYTSSEDGIYTKEETEYQSYGYVSFSRNFNLQSSLFGPVRIVFDRNKLSNKYRIEKYTSVELAGTTLLDIRGCGEAEERISGDINSVLKYIVSIDILNNCACNILKDVFLNSSFPCNFVNTFINVGALRFKR